MQSTLTLAVGVFFVLLALVTATGAVSLENPRTGTSVTGLAYSPLFEILSIGLASVGMAFVYFAGRDWAKNSAAVKKG